MAESSDFDKNRSKINLHEVQQPQERAEVRIVREGQSEIDGFNASAEKEPFPSLKVKIIGAKRNEIKKKIPLQIRN